MPAPFSELPEPAWDAAEPAEPLVSIWVAAAEVPVCCPPSEVLVSFAVAAPFSELPDPAWEAAEPAEPLVSIWVAAAEVPVTWVAFDACYLDGAPLMVNLRKNAEEILARLMAIDGQRLEALGIR